MVSNSPEPWALGAQTFWARRRNPVPAVYHLVAIYESWEIKLHAASHVTGYKSRSSPIDRFCRSSARPKSLWRAALSDVKDILKSSVLARDLLLWSFRMACIVSFFRLTCVAHTHEANLGARLSTVTFSRHLCALERYVRWWCVV